MSKSDAGMLRYISAFQLAVTKHDEAKQTREDNVTPYWIHPLRVVERLRLVGINDYDILSAAILHDVVEDTDTTLIELTKLFGELVSQMVAEVSKGPGQSLQDYHKQLHRASLGGKSIKLADKWDNINELRRMRYPTYGSKEPLLYIEEATDTLNACSQGNRQLARLLKEEIGLAKLDFDKI